jgi:hypothetical protein
MIPNLSAGGNIQNHFFHFILNRGVEVFFKLIRAGHNCHADDEDGQHQKKHLLLRHGFVLFSLGSESVLVLEKYTVMPAILLTFKLQKKRSSKKHFHHSLDERYKTVSARRARIHLLLRAPCFTLSYRCTQSIVYNAGVLIILIHTGGKLPLPAGFDSSSLRLWL